ncbi:MAG: hypothetical protein WCA46_24065 [Actinocatenispora sp.]
MARTITLTRDAEPTMVLAAARSVLQSAGYAWFPIDPSSAEAHEGGRRITSRRMSRRLVLRLAVVDDRLLLTRLTSGWTWMAVLGPLVAMRISAKARRSRRRIRRALRSAGLS